MSTNQAPSQTVDVADYVLSKPPISDSKKPPRALFVSMQIVLPNCPTFGGDKISRFRHLRIRISNFWKPQPKFTV